MSHVVRQRITSVCHRCHQNTDTVPEIEGFSGRCRLWASQRSVEKMAAGTAVGIGAVEVGAESFLRIATQRKRRCLSRSAAQVSLSIVGSKPLPYGRVDMIFGAGTIVTSHRLCLLLSF
jgi:hypothetical protein